MTKPVTTIRLDATLRARIDRHTKSARISLNEFMHLAVTHYLDQHEKSPRKAQPGLLLHSDDLEKHQALLEEIIKRTAK